MHRPLFPRLCRRPDTSLALSKASKMPKMASKTDLGGHQSCQDGPRCLQNGPRGPKEAPRALQEDPQEGPNKPKSLIFIVFFNVFHVIAFSSFRRSKTAPGPQRPPQDAPRGPQEGPKTAQEGLKTA